MSHDEIIKQIKEDLAQLRNEVRNSPRNETRNMLVSASLGAAFALGVFWLAFNLLS